MDKSIIQEIEQKLHSRKMSLLVGAGFSKNANKDFPSWGELLNDMINELYSDSDPQKIITEKGYLGIVDEYIERKGYRESITCYIEDKIRPFLYTPKEELDFSLHSKLLNLPWNNIYTTNYDNLIENADSLTINSYSVVKKSTELSTAPTGRIIKLHGDLRENDEIEFGFDGNVKHHYIISSEDYKTYPEKHEAFTQLMRIALLQESFCLLGFSGDDPNFKGWLEWVKDILARADNKENKVYLIDVNNSEVDRSLELFYKNNNIYHIKLPSLYEKDTIKGLFSSFFDDISKQNTEESINIQKDFLTNAPKHNLKLINSIISSKDIVQKVKEEKSNLKNYIREFNFPSPEAARYLYEHILLKYRDHLPTVLKKSNINDIFEYLSLLSIILNQSYHSIEYIFSKKNLLEIINFFNTINLNQLNDKECWYDFAFIVLNYYRRSDKHEEFILLKEKIRDNSTNIGTINKLYYEEGLLYISNVNLSELEILIAKWLPEKDSIIEPLFLAKKAYLCSYLPERKFLEQSLELINIAYENSNTKSVKLWITELFLFYKMSITLPRDSKLDNEIDILKSNGYYSLRSIYKSFLPHLKNKKLLTYENNRYKSSRKTHIGMSDTESNQWTSIRLLNFVEFAGIPLRLPNLIYNSAQDFTNVFNCLYKDFASEILPYIYQYSKAIGDNRNEYLTPLLQKMLYSKDVNEDIKIYYFCKLKDIFQWYKLKNITYTLFINILPYFSKVIDSRLWEPIIEELFRNESIINNFILWNNDFKSKITETLSVLESEELIMLIMSKLLDEKNEDRMIYISSYLSKLFYISNETYPKSHELFNSYINRIVTNKTITQLDFSRIRIYISFLEEDKRDQVISIILEEGIETYYNHYFFTFLSYYTQYSDELNKQLKKIVLKENLFPTGISPDLKSRSFGGSYPISSMTKTSNEWGIEWTDDEFVHVYNSLKDSWDLLGKWDGLGGTLGYAENEIYRFILYNEERLEKFSDFNKLKEDVYDYIYEQRGYKDLKTALYSRNDDIYRSGLTELYNKVSMDVYFAKNNLDLLRIIINRVLTLDDCCFEYSLEIIIKILTELIIVQDWIKVLIPDYLYILRHFNKTAIRNYDVIHIEICLIELAFLIKNKYADLADKYVEYWLDYKEKSVFPVVKRHKLKLF